MTSMARSHSVARQRVVAALLVAFLLLTTSCEKKAALKTYYSRRRITTENAISDYYSASGSLISEDRVEADKSLDSPSVVLASAGQLDSPDNRKIISNGSLELLVNDVGQSIGKIGSIVTALGGFVEKSSQTNSGGHSASVTVRVPAARLDQAISQIKDLATTVDREGVEAQDVTRQYIDLDARLRNAQAE